MPSASGYARWVLTRRWWIIVSTLVLVASTGTGVRYLYFTTDYRVFFSPENPQRVAFETLEDTYAKNDNVMFILAPRDGDVFTPDMLSLIASITERAWLTPYSTRVDSLTNFQYSYAEGDDLVVRDLVSEPDAFDARELARIRATALAEPLLIDRLVSHDARVTAVSVTVQLPGVHPNVENPQVVSYARELAREVRAANPHVSVRLAGLVMMNNAFTEASQRDMESLVPLSFILMLVTLGVLLRNWSGTVMTLLVIVFSVLTALGIGGYLGVPITPPSASAPTIILTVALAGCVHVLVSFLDGMRSGMGQRDAITESVRVNLQPVFLAATTTTLGFLSMNFSEVPPFRDLGNLVAIGVVSAFVYSVSLLPAAMSLLPARAPRGTASGGMGMATLAEFVVSRRVTLLRGSGLSIIVLLAFVPRNELNDVFVHYFDRDVTFRQDTDFMAENLTGPMQIEYSLEAGESGGIADTGFLEEVERFAAWLRAQPETRHVTVITDIIKRLNQNLHGDDPAWYRIPESRELSAQYLLLYEMSLPYGLDLNNQINLDKSGTRVSVSNRIMSTNEVLAFDNRVYAWLRSNARHIQPVHGTGGPIMFAHIGRRNIVAMLAGTTVALVLISFMLVAAFRSIGIGLVSIVPNLAPAAMGFGLWGIFNGQIGLALSVVTTMTLGIVVDDTVHFLSKYLRARRERGLGARDAVRFAFRHVGRAMLITTIVLVVGFGVLATSHFELNAGMGLLTAIIIAIALAADFLFLPPLLMKLEERSDESLSSRRVFDAAA